MGDNSVVVDSDRVVEHGSQLGIKRIVDISDWVFYDGFYCVCSRLIGAQLEHSYKQRGSSLVMFVSWSAV